MSRGFETPREFSLMVKTFVYFKIVIMYVDSDFFTQFCKITFAIQK